MNNIEIKTVVLFSTNKYTNYLLIKLFLLYNQKNRNYENYELKYLSNRENADEYFSSNTTGLNYCDAILVDYDDLNFFGSGIFTKLKQENKIKPATPIIFLLRKHNTQNLRSIFNYEATGYIYKPIHPKLSIEYIGSCISYSKLQNNLTQQVDKKSKEIINLHEVTIEMLVEILAMRDLGTSEHAKRTAQNVKILCDELIKQGEYTEELTHQNISDLQKAVMLHDIGKIGIPDYILNKKGKLDDTEKKIMNTHTDLGADALNKTASRAKGNSYLTIGAVLAKSHHEKWNGEGYPEKKQGTDIPLFARILIIADIYDALCSERAYKEAMPHEKAISIIKEEYEKKYFDPVIYETFMRIEKKFEEAYQQQLDLIRT